MIGFGPLLRKELLEQWRTRRMLVVAVVFVAIGIGSPFLARYTAELIQAIGGVGFEIEFPEPTTADAVNHVALSTVRRQCGPGKRQPMYPNGDVFSLIQIQSFSLYRGVYAG